MVHHDRPKSGVKITTKKNSQTAHIIRTPRFRPDTLVPKIEIMITMYIKTKAKIVRIICGQRDTINFRKNPDFSSKSVILLLSDSARVLAGFLNIDLSHKKRIPTRQPKLKKSSVFGKITNLPCSKACIGPHHTWQR